MLTAALAPFLPYLIRAGKRTGEEVAEALGTEAGRLAKALWERLRGRIDSREASREAATDVAAEPDDELARAAFTLQLRKLLAEDPTLAKDVGRLLNEAQRDGIIAAHGGVVITGGQHVGPGGVAAGRDIHGGVRTGDQ
jgi:hypothetical protein